MKQFQHAGLIYPETKEPATKAEGRIKWSLEQVADMVNNQYYTLAQCARIIGLHRATISVAIKKQGWKYSRKESKMWKEEA